jgi:hypothetical protein
VLEGTMSFLLGEEWVDAPRGSFVIAPSGMTHDVIDQRRRDAARTESCVGRAGLSRGFS